MALEKTIISPSEASGIRVWNPALSSIVRGMLRLVMAAPSPSRRNVPRR